MRTYSFKLDFAGLALLVLAILLIVGVVALTPLSVGIGLILAKSDLSYAWNW